MARRAAKIDRNQPEIVAALRQAGCKVQSLAKVGDGCADLLVGVGGKLYVLEVKDGELSQSRQKLTPDEARWHQEWAGYATVVTSVHDAFVAVGLLARPAAFRFLVTPTQELRRLERKHL